MSNPPNPALRVSRSPGRTAVRFPNTTSLTEANIDAVGRELSQIAENSRGGHLLIDLANVDFLNSTALGQLVALHKRVRAAGGRLTLQNIRPMVREVFAVTRLDQIIEVDPAAHPEARSA